MSSRAKSGWIIDSRRIAASVRSLTIAALIVLGAFSGCASPQAKVDLVYFPPPPVTAHAVHLLSFNNLGDLAPAEQSWLSVLRGATGGPFVTTPAGMAYRDDVLYICDIGQNVVHRWNLQDRAGRRLGEGQLVKPVDVAVDEAGVVYVADTGLAEVVAIGSDGKIARRLKPPDREGYRPVAAAVHGQKLCVADIHDHRVDVFATDDGRLLDSFGGAGDAPGEFFYPVDLAFTPDGRLCVLEMMNPRVQVFDIDAGHSLVTTFGKPGDRYGALGKPKRIEVGPDGVVFIADVGFAYIQLFDLQGRLLMLLGSGGEGHAATPMPSGLAIAGSLPEPLAGLVPTDFEASYFLFASNSVGSERVSLYAIGLGRPAATTGQ